MASLQEPCRVLGYGFTQLTRHGTDTALALMLRSLTMAMTHAGLENADLDGLVALPSLMSEHQFMQVCALFSRYRPNAGGTWDELAQASGVWVVYRKRLITQQRDRLPSLMVQSAIR